MSRSAALAVARRLVEAGHRTVLAGGCVRDRLLGRSVRDLDIATAATPDEVRALFARTVAVGEAFGVVKVVTDDGVFDVATFRRDVGIADGRHPERVEPATLEEDLRRRDFTINALVEDPVSGEVLDLVGGLDDLRAGLVRALGEPALRFREDALRLLRGVRFAVVLGFRIEPDTLRAMGEEAAGLARVSGERVREELARMLAEPGRERSLELLAQTGLLPGALPECAAALAEGARRGRVAGVLAALPGVVELPLALAALALEASEEPAAAALALAARLRLSRAATRRLTDLIELQPAVAAVASGSRADRRRLLGHAACGEALALDAARGGDGSGRAALRVEREVLGGDPPLPDPFLAGADVLARGVAPGPEVGRWLERAYELQLEGRLTTRDAALTWLRDGLPG